MPGVVPRACLAPAPAGAVAGFRLDDYSTRFTNTPANGSTVVRRDDMLWNHQLGLVYKPVDNSAFHVSHATSSTPANVTLGQGV